MNPTTAQLHSRQDEIVQHLRVIRCYLALQTGLFLGAYIAWLLR